jgi:hypothetical protein
MLDRSPEDGGDRTEDYFADLRRRYGRRVPEPVVREFLDKRLARVRAEKKKILTTADREGKTINIDGLRQGMTENLSEMSPSAREYAMSVIDRTLLRLEVKHGPEIPVTAVSEEADLADERVRKAEEVP